MSVDPFSTQAAENFLSGGAPAAKWAKVGDTFEGTVLSWEMAQQTDYDSGEPAVWSDGKPKMQLIITVQSEPTGFTYEGLRYDRVELPDDDGIRRLFVKAGLQSAFRLAKQKQKFNLEAGALVKVTRTKDGPKSNPKYAAPHRYQVEWTPAAQNPKAGDFLDQLQEGEEENPFA